MITENTLGDKNLGVDYGRVNNPPIETTPFTDSYISTTENESFSNNTASDSHHENKITNNNNPSKTNLQTNHITTIIPSCRSGISILMDLPLKIINGVSDLLNFQSNDSPESEIPAKRPYSPRPHNNGKQNPLDIARGRGRGRGRSQLRRSGVSQTRHRQERIRQRLSADIQDDLKVLREWEDAENIEDEIPGTPCVDDNGTRIRYNADGPLSESNGSSKFPFSFSYCDLKRRKRRNEQNKSGRISIGNNCKVRFIPEFCPIDAVARKVEEDVEEKDEKDEAKANRKRLQSDRSVDSEDSCYIVFENGSESEYETDYDYTSTDDEEEDDEADDRGAKLKVRFSPNPKIHTMITWDYAYRAARRGPWEEMARDRERFKYRINCIGRILDPILVPQHRSEIWQHRFAVEI